MTTETKKFNFFAVSAGVTLAIYLSGAVYALVTKDISFAEFLAAVSGPLGIMTGWAAKQSTTP